MRQPFVAVLAIVTVIAVTLAGTLLIRSVDSENHDEYSQFHRDPTHIVSNENTKASVELDEIWASVGWMGHEVKYEGVILHAYVESAWAVARDKTYTYFSTCAHGVRVTGTEDLVIGYWHDNKWNFVRAIVVAQLSSLEGDAALLRVSNSSLLRMIPPLKLASNQTFSAGDEILIGGVQPSSGPAFICLGTISMVNMHKPEFVVKGWAWFGFSGGPVRLRKTGEVIGYIRSSTLDHPRDASESICGDYNLIHKLLIRAGVDNLVGK